MQENTLMKDTLIEIRAHCNAIIVYRMRPIQKAQVIEMVR